MSDIVSPLLQWLNANPQWAGFVTFIISASESVAIIGTIVPGSITMTAIGTLAGAGIIPLWPTIIWAILGAVVGDGISYWIGHYFKEGLRNVWPFKSNPNILIKGETFVQKYGVMSVFIGRFVGPVRALVPLVAGMLGMKPLQFTLANVTSAIIWAPAYMLPGIVLGAASLELPPEIALHVIIVLFMISLFIMLCLWCLYKLLQLISKQTDFMLDRLWMSLEKSTRLNLSTVILKHHDSKEHHGQLVLAFYFILTSILFLALCLYVKIMGPANLTVNDVLYHLFRGLRTPSLDNIMLTITTLGQKHVVLPIVFLLFVWLLVTRRTRAALHALALALLAAASVIFFKFLIQSPRPWGIFHGPETYSMPSGHTTLATTIYMGIAFMIASTLPRQYRYLIYTPAAIVVFLVSISRVYLGAHWFTDVLSAWLLSASLLIIVILSFNRQYEKRLDLISVSAVCFSTLLVSYSIYSFYFFHTLKINYTQLNWPSSYIPLDDWWQRDELIPAHRVSLFGYPSQNINVQWTGPIDQIRKTLLEEGWEDPPARNWISMLHRLSDVKSTEYLPLVSPQYLDKKPLLILAKKTNSGKKLIVLRLWGSNRTIKETQKPLWVGTVGIVPSSYSWLIRKRRDIEIKPSLLFQLPTSKKAWQWKMMTLSLPKNSHKFNQNVILIKENK
jgi:membrane protein DedA with SNARE-associated domain/membrane-associated phospholipid phosphatase